MNNLTIPKPHVCIIFGGKSAEHDISILSAKNIAAALDRNQFEPSFIYIDKQGGWHRAKAVDVVHTGQKRGLDTALLDGVDVVFPVLHGPMGEDGTMQGFLEIMGIPYVGCRVLGSAINMDKDIAKRLLRQADIPIAKHLCLRRQDRVDPEFIVANLGLPLFVKPANMGSSIGISKITDLKQLHKAIATARQYDVKIILEQAIDGVEIECAILGTNEPQASIVGKIVPKAQFYTYDAKYHDEHGTELQMPADIPADVAAIAQKRALEAYMTLECQGLSRVDMFLRPDNSILINEINTMPGFTQYSMYPGLWQLSGVEPQTLITNLIAQALSDNDTQ